MLTMEERYEYCREHQFEPEKRYPERVNVLVNSGAIEIKEESVLIGSNTRKNGVLVKVKDIETFADFKRWCDSNSIPTSRLSCDEHLRTNGIILYDGMPYNVDGCHQVIRLDVNTESSGEDIMEVSLRYYSI